MTGSRVFTRRSGGWAGVIAVLLAALGPATARADLPAGTWSLDRVVDAVATAPDGTSWLATQFPVAPRATVGGGYLAPAVGDPEPVVSAATRVAGQAYRVLADGAGGFFITGGLVAVGGERVSGGLAHLHPDGTLDRGWRTDLDVSGAVAQLAVAGGRLYVSASGRVQAVDAATGRSVGEPVLTSDYAGLVTDGDRVYVVGQVLLPGDGDFTDGPIAIDGASGAILPWRLGAAETGTLVAADAGTLLFSRPESVPTGYRYPLVARDAASGALRWSAAVDGQFYSVVIAGGTAYLAGGFREVAGLPRPGVAAVDLATGVPTAFAPSGLPLRPQRVAVDAHAVHVIGAPLSPQTGGSDFYGGAAASLDPGTGALQSTGVTPGRYASDIAVGPGTVYVTGDFTGAGAPLGPEAAVFRVNPDGSLDTDFAVETTDAYPGSERTAVAALAAGGGRLYLAGAFAAVAGAPRAGLAAVDATTGALTPWAPEAIAATISALAYDDGTLWAGGSFPRIGGETRAGLAGLDGATGAVVGAAPPWQGDGTGRSVASLAAAGGRVYVGGLVCDGCGRYASAFTTTLDGGTGVARGPETRLPALDVDVAATGTRGWVTAGGLVSALDPATGAVTALPEQPGKRGAVKLAAAGDTLYATAGYAGAPRGIFAMDGTTGALLGWDAQIGAGLTASVFHVAASRRGVVGGGDFLTAGTEVAGRFVRLPGVPPPTPAVAGVTTLRLGVLARRAGLGVATDGLARSRPNPFAVRLPVTSGLAQIVEERGVVSQAGTVLLEQDGGSLSLTDPRVDLFAAQLTAVVRGRRIPVLALDYTRAVAGTAAGLRFGPVRTSLTAAGAAALSAAFPAGAFAAGDRVGSLTLDVRTVPADWPPA